MTDIQEALNEVSNMVSELAVKSMDELYKRTPDNIPELIMVCAGDIRDMRDKA